MIRRQPMRRSGTLKRRTPLKRSGKLKPGKKTLAWGKVRSELKAKFQEHGVTSCELRLSGCWRDNGLGFAHGFKRRNITTKEQLRAVALLCSVCHDAIEIKPEAEMAVIVHAIIQKRGWK